MTNTSIKLRVQPDAEAVANAAAQMIFERANQSQDRFSICLSGGSTPKALYQILASPLYSQRFPWKRVHWFFGDERFVSQDSSMSNFKMVRESMFDHVPIPEENIHGVNTSYPTASEAAFDYGKRLQAFYGSEHIQPDKPIFDYTLMGMGDDGHTASLFPGTEVLNETEKWCDAVCGVKAEDRITLTYPVLNASRVMLFLVASKSKREVLGKILDGDTTYPAARVKPWGSLIWLVDQDAAPEKS
ncbi:6-phosphogluconolactonase [bacterium]|nr:6-phosphogluconolactonase [bacterium]QQR56660.1 MAG: 6-phosphogluconolactonase [Candidatus Melainabacteria bacterium]